MEDSLARRSQGLREPVALFHLLFTVTWLSFFCDDRHFLSFLAAEPPSLLGGRSCTVIVRYLQLKQTRGGEKNNNGNSLHFHLGAYTINAPIISPTVSIVLVAVGFIVAVISFIAYFGAHIEHSGFLKSYSGATALFLIIEVVLIALAYAHRREVLFGGARRGAGVAVVLDEGGYRQASAAVC